MSDLYGTNARSSSLESEEMSSFLHNLLHNSSLPSPSSCESSRAKQLPSFSSPSPQPPMPGPEITRLFRRSGAVVSGSDCGAMDGASTAGLLLMVDSTSGSNFSDPGSFFPAVGEESKIGVVDTDAITSLAKTRKLPEKNDVNELSFNGERGHETSDVHQVPPRSKRTRAAEVHNLSEKRRRSRINEKLKALQNLIPNSNKTDKASMLDEAIEYLKQLQLQVQMLSMRNGLSLHPTYIPHPMQLPEMGIFLDERNGLRNTSRRADAFSGNREISTKPPFDLSNQCTSSYQPVVIPPIVNVNPETSFGLESHSESL